MSSSESERPGLLFVSSIRLPPEDDPTARKKWNGLAERFRTFVIGFSNGGFTRRRLFNTTFYGLPGTLWFPLRVLLYYLLTPVLAGYLSLRYRIKSWTAQGPYEAASVYALKYVLKPVLGIRLIIEAHGDWIDSFARLRSLPFPGLLTGFLRMLSPVFLFPADALRSVSATTRDLLETHSGGRRAHLTFPGFTDLDVFLRSTLEEKEQREDDYVLYVGALTELKGLPELLEAINLADQNQTELPLKLYGSGTLDAFRKRARTIGIEDRVKFHGEVDQAELREQYLGARLLVLPSKTEGLPRVLLESLACYTPFVATRTPGSEEVRDNSGGGITVPVGDPRRLAEAMVDLYESPSERRSRGKRGRNFVETTYSNEGYFANYEQLVTLVHSDDPTGG